MKKKLAPFLSGIGTGLCLAVVILTLWGVIWPNKQDLEAKDLDQVQPAVANNIFTSSETDLTESESQSKDPQPGSPQSHDPETGVKAGTASALPQEGSKVIEIKAGMSAKQISDLLAQEGIIDNAQNFHKYSIEHSKTRRFMIGKFTLRSGMPYEELLVLLTIPS